MSGGRLFTEGEPNLIEIAVALPHNGYKVYIGDSILSIVRQIIPAGVSKIAVVTQPGIPYSLSFGEIPSRTFLIPPTESAKHLGVVQSLVEEIAEFGLSRSDLIIALGGGVVTDVAGFVASIYFRGISYINVATTLLAQVDAAIGGKTGVNLTTGKNLVGTFWQPLAVVCDVATLATLEAREFRSGLGEMAKYVFLGSGSLDEDDLENAVSRCVRIKAEVIANDERENGGRALLNYGHTMGHALEALGLEGKIELLYHGEAVAIGLLFAAHLAFVLGRIDTSQLTYHYQVVSKFKLPTIFPSSVDLELAMPFLERDKKAQGSLAFVLQKANGDLELVRGIERQQVGAAIASFRAWR